MSSEKNSCTPKLRFPGFTGDWEEKGLSKCLEERNEQFPEDDKYPLMAFVAEKGVSPKGEKYDRSALVKDVTNKKYKRTELGDFIYSSNNLEAGSIGFNTYGSACISPVYSIFKSKNNVDPTFIGTLLTQKRFIAEMVKYRQGVVYGQWKIPEKEFLKIKVSIPSPAEQKKISECLSVIDDMISAQGDKVDVLKQKKRALMQQLFPQQGETTPRLRFPGFTGEWEEKKLRDVCTIVDEKCSIENLNIATYISTENMLQNLGGIKNATKLPSSGSFTCFLKGDILFSNIRPYLRKVWLAEFDGAVSNDVIVFRVFDIYNHIFISQIIKSDFFIAHSMLGAKGVKMPRGDKKMMMDYPFLVPSSFDEQQKIASCLSTLDSLIASESAKLDSLKDHKKGLMQQLFPEPSK